MHRLAQVLAACLGALPMAGVCTAHTLRAPASVVAQPDGSFEYEFVFTAISQTSLAGSGWNGVVNVMGGIAADCFCFEACAMAPGDSLVMSVTGSLTDPDDSGSVRNWVALCDELGNEATTEVLPHSVLAIDDQSASRMRLSNTPNPFTGQTTFHYATPAAGRVVMRVHDALGRHVATLLDGYRTAGPHSFTWQPEGASHPVPGVYFVRLEADGTVLTRTIVVGS